MRRRLLRFLGYTALILAALVAAAVIVVESPWLKEKVRILAIERTKKTINGTLTIGRVSGSLLRGVTLEDVSIAQNGRVVISVPEIRVRYDPLVLIKGHVSLENIALKSPRIIAIQDEHGWNLAHLVNTTDSGPPVDFVLSHITITDGIVQVEPLHAAARQVSDLQTEVQLSRLSGELSVNVPSLTARDDRTGFRIQRFRAAFKGALQDLTSEFAAASATSTLAGSVNTGRADAEAPLHFAGAVDMTRLDLETLFEDKRWKSNLTGHATFAAAVPSGAAPDVSFTFNGPSVAAFGYEGQAVDASGHYAHDRLDFKARAQAYGAGADVSGRWTNAATPKASGALTLAGTLRRVNLAQLPKTLPVPALQTDLAGHFSMTWHGTTWSADAELDRSRLEGATIGAGTVGHADGDSGAIRYRAQGTMAGFNPRLIAGPLKLPSLDAPRFEGTLTGSFTADGVEPKTGPRSLNATATLRDSTIAGVHTKAMDTTVALDGSALAIHANGDFTHVTAEAAGLPVDTTMDVNGAANVDLRFADLSAPVTLTSLDITGQAQLTASTARGIALEQASIDATLQEGVATIRQLAADGKGLHVTAQGTVALGDTGSSNLDVQAGADDLKMLGDALGQPLAGGADVTARVTGPANALHTAGDLKAREFAYGDAVTALTLNTTFTADVANQQWNDAIVHTDSDGAFLKVGGFDIVRLTNKATYQHHEVELDAHIEEEKRTLDASGVVRLNEGTRDITLRGLALSTAGTAWQLAPGQEARITLNGETVCIDGLDLRRNEQAVNVRGTLALSEPVPTATGLTIQLSQVQLADLNRLMLGTRTLGGTINGTVHVNGTAKAPAADGDVTIADGLVEQVHYDALRARVQYTPGRAVVNATLDQTAANHLTAEGVVPIGTPAGVTPAPLDLRVKSTPIDLGIVQAFTTEVEQVTGTGQFDLRLTGTMDAPNVDGTVTIAGGGFKVPATGVGYGQLQADLVFEGQRLLVRSLHGADDDGHPLEVSGGLGILGEAAGTDVNVHVVGDRIHVLNNPFGVMQINVDMSLVGSLAAPKLTGELSVDQGRIEVGRVLETTTKSVYSTTPQGELEATNAPPPPPGPFDRLEMAIKLTMPDNLVMRGRDLRVGGASMSLGDMNIIAGGQLNIQKAAGGSTTILGGLEIVRGYYSFQGKRFQVERDSEVRFRGDDLTNPSLNITGTQDISGVTASVQVQGTAKRPTVKLSSRPPLDEADILSLIVFGQPVNDLGEGQRSSLTEKAAGLAAGAVATPVADSVARALNLDLFEIEAPSADQKNPVVSLGSQIGTRLYVAVRQAIGHEESSSVSIEYRFADFVRLITTIAQGSLQERSLGRAEAGGVDLLFVFKY